MTPGDTGRMRALLSLDAVVPTDTDLSDEDLLQAYAADAASRLRANFVMSIDGAATGADHRSGSINTPADHEIFDLLRAISDVVIVGAGTIRSEKYTPLAVTERWRQYRADTGRSNEIPLVVVTEGGEIPEPLRGAPKGSFLIATSQAAPGLTATVDALGEENTLIVGEEAVDLKVLCAALRERGWHRQLTEGGPTLLTSMLDAGVVDELCLTIAPLIAGDSGVRIVKHTNRTHKCAPRLLLEGDGTIIGRWAIEN